MGRFYMPCASYLSHMAYRSAIEVFLLIKNQFPTRLKLVTSQLRMFMEHDSFTKAIMEITDVCHIL